MKLKYTFESYKNQKFARLTLIGPAEAAFNSRKTLMNQGVFKCECGAIKVLRIENVVKGASKSCGCLRAEKSRTVNLLPLGEASFNSLIHNYKSSAKERNLQFNLSNDEARSIFVQNCHYCGKPPSMSYKYCSKMKPENGFKYNGIDRIDNNKDYEISNVVSACWPCNKRKGSMQYQEFIDWVSSIAKHLKLGEKHGNLASSS